MTENTIDYSGLTTKAQILLTDLMALSDKNGVLYKKDLQSFVNLFSTTSGVDFKGKLLIADTPVDGWYFAGESGTYTNADSLVVDVSDNIAIIIVSNSVTTFEKIDIPVTISIDATPTSGSTKLVQSGGVFDELALKADTSEIYTGGETTNSITFTNGQEVVNVDINSPLVEVGAYSTLGVKNDTGLNDYRMIDPVRIAPGKRFRYEGETYASDNIALVIRDADGNITRFINTNQPVDNGTSKIFDIVFTSNEYDILLCWIQSPVVLNMKLIFDDTDVTVSDTTEKTYQVVKSITKGSATKQPKADGNIDISSFFGNDETPLTNKNIIKNNYALYPDKPLSIIQGDTNTALSNVEKDTSMFDIMTHTVVNSNTLGKGFRFNIANDSNKTIFTFTWSVENYFSFVLHKSTIEIGDSLGFSNSTGGFNWINLSTKVVTGNAGFNITVVEENDNYLRIQCHHETNERKKIWFDFDSTSNVTLYDLIVSKESYNVNAIYKHEYELFNSQHKNNYIMSFGDSNHSWGILKAYKDFLGVNVINNSGGGRRIGLNNGVNFSEITTSDHKTQTGDGNWLYSWYRKKIIKDMIDTYGIDIFTFYMCYNDGAGDAFMNSSGSHYIWYEDIPDGTQGDFTNYSELSEAAIAAVEYNYPQITDTEAEQDVKYARFLALTSAEKKQIFAYKQCYAALIKEILTYQSDCIISCNSLLYLPASDGGGVASTSFATYQNRRAKFKNINNYIKEIADYFGAFFCDNNGQTGYTYGNASVSTPDGTHFTANVGYGIGFNTSNELNKIKRFTGISDSVGSGPIVS